MYEGLLLGIQLTRLAAGALGKIGETHIRYHAL